MHVHDDDAPVYGRDGLAVGAVKGEGEAGHGPDYAPGGRKVSRAVDLFAV